MDTTEYISPVTGKDIETADFISGSLLLVDKPKSWTSFDVVKKIRSALRHTLNVKKMKVGHAGTLDPMATGLLLICTGKYTKKISQLQAMKKTYTGTLRLGATTPTYDAESQPDATFSTAHINRESIAAALRQFQGDIEQIPPMYSAVKKDGKRLYDLAREGKRVELQARPVTIYSFEITGYRMPELDFEVRCSKGTYIRSLAYDLGKVLNSGAYLTALRRTATGPYRVEDAWTIEAFSNALR